MTGLLVIAISINLPRILSYKHLLGRAAEALITFVAALVLISLWLIPNQTLKALGIETLAIGLFAFVSPVVFQFRARHAIEGITRTRRVVRAIIDLSAGLVFITAGCLLIAGSNAGLTWGAAGVIVSLVAGVLNAWVLLVEILR